MTEKQRQVIITESGQQIPVEAGVGVEVSFYLPDDPVKEVVLLDVSDQEFAAIQKRALTNDVPADILSDKKAN